MTSAGRPSGDRSRRPRRRGPAAPRPAWPRRPRPRRVGAGRLGDDDDPGTRSGSAGRARHRPHRARPAVVRRRRAVGVAWRRIQASSSAVVGVERCRAAPLAQQRDVPDAAAGQVEHDAIGRRVVTGLADELDRARRPRPPPWRRATPCPPADGCRRPSRPTGDPMTTITREAYASRTPGHPPALAPSVSPAAVVAVVAAAVGSPLRGVVARLGASSVGPGPSRRLGGLAARRRVGPGRVVRLRSSSVGSAVSSGSAVAVGSAPWSAGRRRRRRARRDRWARRRARRRRRDRRARARSRRRRRPSGPSRPPHRHARRRRPGPDGRRRRASTKANAWARTASGRPPLGDPPRVADGEAERAGRPPRTARPAG